GAVEAQPNIAVSPSSLNFGEVLVGTEESQILTIGNDGTGILAITAITLSDNQNFALDLNQGVHPCGTLPLSFDAGEDCTLAVIFAPDEEGGFSESLVIDSDDPDQPQLTVALTSDSPDLDGGGCSLQGGASPAGFAVAIFGLLGLLGLRLRRN
ncbi:MAG TPA: choice-of-anchor D domain-containing protein, partial [bacterium]|nr:choice-of-anchor D domain-containing protein [bacterium]